MLSKIAIICISLILLIFSTSFVTSKEWLLTDPHEFYGYVKIVKTLANGTFHCSGTLIEESHVITSVLCLEGADANQISLKGDYLAAQQPRQAIKIYRHDKFSKTMVNDMTKVTHDIAIIFVEPPFNKTDTFKPARLAKLSPGREKECRIAGSHLENTSEDEVHAMTANVVNEKDCKSMYLSDVLWEREIFCAGTPNDETDYLNTCLADSGSGLMCEHNTLYGVFSFITTCQQPFALSDVSEYQTFIDRTLYFHRRQDTIKPPTSGSVRTIVPEFASKILAIAVVFRFVRWQN